MIVSSLVVYYHHVLDVHCPSSVCPFYDIETLTPEQVLLFALDNTIVATIQPAIVETFNDQQSLAWIGVSFVLGQVVILPVCVIISILVLYSLTDD